MAVKKKKKFIHNNKGQAVFEFVIFVPFMLIVYLIMVSFGNAINGSINQQKAVRGYFHTLVKGNSMIPRKDVMEGNSGIDQFGMFYIGWREKESGNIPLAPCYKVKNLIAPTEEETCDSGYSEPTTQFIRVMTAYGLCATTYRFDTTVNDRVKNPANEDSFAAAKTAGCTNI